MNLTDDQLKELGITQEQIAKIKVSERESELRNLQQCEALIDAGWKYELPEIVNRKEEDPAPTLFSENWQWYWRRPPRKPGSKGMRFASTQQAYNHLTKKQ